MIASVVSARASVLVVLCSVLVVPAVGCADHDPQLTHVGQSYPPADAGPTPMGDAGDSAAPVPWCAAYQIINCVCQQCHRSPPLNGAPISLLNYADTQAPFPLPSSKNHVWQTMEKVIGNDFMPYTGDDTVMPKVLPLTPDQKQLMLRWLGEGAHDEGGHNCGMTCDWDKGPPPGRQ